MGLFGIYDHEIRPVAFPDKASLGDIEADGRIVAVAGDHIFKREFAALNQLQESGESELYQGKTARSLAVGVCGA